MPKKAPIIIKANGDTVRFSRRRLLTSLLRSGAPKQIANTITDTVSADIIHGKTTTQDIYGRAYTMLKKLDHRPIAAKYSLKKAIMALGPTGYPFERFVSEILQAQGYSTKVGVIVQGSCVPHEVDVVAVRDGVHVLVEAKFHNQPGVHTDVKVPLYIHSRFLDIEKQLKSSGDTHIRHEPWIVTNTHFTTSAIDYASCMGMTLIGWRYPESGGLEKMIEDASLHPITCLSTINKDEMSHLLAKNIVLCKDLLNNQQILGTIGVSRQRTTRMLQEAHVVCTRA